MSKPVAFVTGGASGIGLTTAEHLISRGYRVAIADINHAQGIIEAEKLSNDCTFLQVDVSDYSMQAHAMKKAFEWGGGRLDVFVANAGIADTQSIYTEGELDQEGLPKPLSTKVFDVNLNAVVQGVHLFKHFAKKNPTPGGTVVVTASVVGIYPNYAIPLYSASKHALVGFVRCVAPVFAVDGITINAICPVLVATNLMPEHVRDAWDKTQLTPMTTAMRAYDTFLDNKSMTGQTVELALDDLVFKQPPEYSTANVRWMFEQTELWEKAVGGLLPRPPGQNVRPLT